MPKGHKEHCICSVCRAKRGEVHGPHKPYCTCGSCQAKRGNNPFFGKHHTEEAKQRQRIGHLGMHYPSHKEGCLCGSCRAKRGDNPMLGRIPSKETRMKIGLKNKGKVRTEEAKQRMRDSHPDTSGANNPMFGKPQSEETKEKRVRTRLETAKRLGYYHSDETVSKMLHSNFKNPSTFEIRLIIYLNIFYPNLFIYTGHGSFVKGSRSADFYSKRLNAVILAQGDYYHCNPEEYASDYYHRKRKMTAQEIWDYDQDTIRRFEKLGYKVIVIWEGELNKVWPKEIREVLHYLPTEEKYSGNAH